MYIHIYIYIMWTFSKKVNYSYRKFVFYVENMDISKKVDSLFRKYDFSFGNMNISKS